MNSKPPTTKKKTREQQQSGKQIMQQLTTPMMGKRTINATLTEQIAIKINETINNDNNVTNKSIK